MTAQLVRDGSVSGILSRTTLAGDKAFYGYDGNGNVTLLTDASGTEVGRYRYDAFGVTLEAIGTKAADNPYRFSTKEQHGASGLYDFGYRFYSPGMGRWINRDPLGEAGGVNLYAAMGNNAVNSVDEYGLSPEDNRPCMHDGIANSCGPTGSKPAPRPKPWTVIGGTPADRARVDGIMADIFRTKKGKELLKMIEGPSNKRMQPVKIYLSNERKYYASGLKSRSIRIDPRFSPDLLYKGGIIEPASLESILAHELGHAVAGTADDGPRRMNNINKWENPIMLDPVMQQRAKRLYEETGYPVRFRERIQYELP